MLPFDQETDTAQQTPRWNIGIDYKHAALYICLALLGGLVIGFFAGRYSLHNTDAAKDISAKIADVALEDGSVSKDEHTASASNSEYHRVTKVVRADTIEVEGFGRVRLIGVETPDGRKPEQIYGMHGKNARAFAEKQFLSQDVRIEFDPAFTSQNNKNEAGQLMAYVYNKDGTLVNGEMIRQGHAFLRTADPFRMIEEFRALERDAMQSMRGVWGLGGSQASTAPVPASSPDPKQKKLSPLLPSELDSRLSTSSGPIVYVSTKDRLYHKEGCEDCIFLRFLEFYCMH